METFIEHIVALLIVQNCLIRLDGFNAIWLIQIHLV